MKQFTMLDIYRDKRPDDSESRQQQYMIRVKTPMPETTIGELMDRVPHFGMDGYYKIILSWEEDGDCKDILVTAYDYPCYIPDDEVKEKRSRKKARTSFFCS